MRNGHLEQQKVDQVLSRIPETRAVFRGYGIDCTSRLTLADAAAAVSAHPDALLAEVEFRSRRLARQRAQLRRELVNAEEIGRELAIS